MKPFFHKITCVTLSPCPSRPYSPHPQVNSSPLLVMAALCELPQAMSLTLLFFRASINLCTIITVSQESLILCNINLGLSMLILEQ